MAFHNVQFPTDISRGCTGGPSWRTTVVTSASGHEQRLGLWSLPRRTWDVSLQSWDEDRLEAILAFFIARQGKLHGFRFKDWSDYYAGMTQTSTGLTYNTAANSELFGTGDGSDVTFQLTKAYTSGSTTHTRNITRPVSGTIKIYVNNVLKTETTDYTINYDTGMVTFGTAPTTGHAIRWAGKFDIPARFDTDEMALNMDAVVSGAWTGIPIIELRE